MLRLRCPITSITSTPLPLHYRYKPQCKGSHKTNELLLADSIALTKCVQKPCLCAATPIQRLCRMLMFSEIFCEPAAAVQPAACRRASLQRLSPVMNHLLSASCLRSLIRTFYLQRICPITSNTAREERKEKASSLLSASTQPPPRQTIQSPPPPALAFLLARRE